ncbi:hypothetical protein G647_06056 [Cladophialophora carrionii CBS 160.54]|uniref:JmjC domain-containing protein n=1 Tax=Cladophialophora carrionii CBS 160.54 TaxID=1279043 RepID=V9D5R0_9EURO|nr:uncharacterized protein G647_06056 [Cladophialophora carrionii CBS 160.54]ETI21986.1 hypothetical protein G647_06056 [Cladophialophora carrionii CBS 160.54]
MVTRPYRSNTDSGTNITVNASGSLRWVSPSRSSVRQLTTSTATEQSRRRGLGPLRDVPVLPSWHPSTFEQAFKEGLPVRLPRSREHIPPACFKWFVHDGNPGFDLFGGKPRGERHDTSMSARSNVRNADTNHDTYTDCPPINVPKSSELRPSFWQGYKSTVVALEVTTKQDGSDSEHFERLEGPLEVLLAHLSRSQTLPKEEEHVPRLSIYLAQSDLSTLPPTLRDDVPIPALLRSSSPHATDGSTNRSMNGRTNESTSTSTNSTRPIPTIKGDIYASSLWMGRPPTYTPLHRDPNPNLFIQLAGRKTIRLLPPEIGDAIYRDVMSTLGDDPSSFSTKIRGEEMMVGPEMKALHDCIWGERRGRDEDGYEYKYADLLWIHGLETTLGLGDALFTPKGWWHSVKGVGPGVTASVNWWFR